MFLEIDLVMISARAQFVAVTLCALVTACARPTGVPIPIVLPIASRPDVIITFDGERHACVGALIDETTGRATSCDGVLPFMRDALKLRSGSIYDIRTIPDVDEAQMHVVTASLKDAGYRFIEAPHVLFLTGPHRDRE